MSKYWSEVIKKVEPYVPGEQPRDRNYIKLNTNECPYPPSQKVINAIIKATNDSLRLYPDPTCDEIVEVIALYHGLEKEQVFVGNGSDELLAFAFKAFFNPGKHILFPDVTYSFYPVYSKLFNIDYKAVPVNDDFDIDVEGFLQKNGGIIIPNPNAPTSKLLSLKEIAKILEANMESVVIIDEAYIDFGGESSIKLINEYSNLLVVQTLSKSRALAGLRVGFALGNRELIDGLERVKNSFNSYTLDRLAIKGAVAAFEDQSYFNEVRVKIIATREKISKELGQLGFKVIDSSANFVFVSHERVNAALIFNALRDRGILVRYFNKPRIDNYLRITIGTDEEMDEFIRVLNDIIKKL